MQPSVCLTVMLCHTHCGIWPEEKESVILDIFSLSSSLVLSAFYVFFFCFVCFMCLPFFSDIPVNNKLLMKFTFPFAREIKKKITLQYQMP